MFTGSTQPAVVSLFSSTGSEPLSLWESKTDASLPSDSFICLLHDSTLEPRPPPPQSLIPTGSAADEASPGYSLDQTVLHIQSPTLRTTFIRCPPGHGTSSGETNSHLGLKHPWLHLQVRNLGREWAFEVGIVDQAGREGVVRCATFQKVPKIKLANIPLLVLPLSFPPPSSRPLTSWSTIALNLPSLIPHFSSASLAQVEDSDQLPLSPRFTQTRGVQVPGGIYSHVSYVKVYATCRLRRIWLSEAGPQQQLPWEFQLYASDGLT